MTFPLNPKTQNLCEPCAFFALFVVKNLLQSSLCFASSSKALVSDEGRVFGLCTYYKSARLVFYDNSVKLTRFLVPRNDKFVQKPCVQVIYKVLLKTIALAQIAVEILLWSLRSKRLERIAGLASKNSDLKEGTGFYHS